MTSTERDLLSVLDQARAATDLVDDPALRREVQAALAVVTSARGTVHPTRLPRLGLRSLTAPEDVDPVVRAVALHFAGRIAGLESEMLAHRSFVGARLVDARAELNAARAEMRNVVESMRRQEGRTVHAQQTLRDEQGGLQASVERLRASIEDLASRLDAVDADPSPRSSAARARSEAVYLRFEDMYRGDAELIRSRLEPYLDDLDLLRTDDSIAIDVGCGRGEWLVLLREAGIRAVGIDTNAVMVDACHEQGLDAWLGDAVDLLAAQEPDTVGAVTAFHVVEHVSLPDLVLLLDAAYGALKPGGVLLLETPNPTNLVVGAAAFYRDPTHRRPLHPDLLSFMASEAGFGSVEVRYLHPVDDAASANGIADGAASLDSDIAWALKGPQDYAVVARKLG